MSPPTSSPPTAPQEDPPNLLTSALWRVQNYLKFMPAPDPTAGIYKVPITAPSTSKTAEQKNARSVEEAANHSQAAQVDQNFPLSGLRVVSNIPRGGGAVGKGGCPVDHESSGGSGGGGCPVDHTSTTPHHQLHPTTREPLSNDKWAYPSEQQYYNAITRKGWRGVTPQDVPSIVAIHNAVNEEGWRVCKFWESVQGLDNANVFDPTSETTLLAPASSPSQNKIEPRLLKFEGRPGALSPKSFFNHYVLGYSLPFDRHDWFVSRTDSNTGATTTVRYIVEFYSGSQVTNGAKNMEDAAKQSRGGGRVNMYLDVRPAVDSFGSVFERVKMKVVEIKTGGGA